MVFVRGRGGCLAQLVFNISQPWLLLALLFVFVVEEAERKDGIILIKPQVMGVGRLVTYDKPTSFTSLFYWNEKSLNVHTCAVDDGRPGA